MGARVEHSHVAAVSVAAQWRHHDSHHVVTLEMYEVLLQTRRFERLLLETPIRHLLCYRMDHRYFAQNDEFNRLLSQRIIRWYEDASDQKVPHELELGLGLGPELSCPMGHCFHGVLLGLGLGVRVKAIRLQKHAGQGPL